MSEDPLETLTANGRLQAWTLDPTEPPLFVAPAASELSRPGALARWLHQNLRIVDALLLLYGGIVFRGFSVSSTADFNAVAEQFELFKGNYQGGGAPRKRIAGRVYEATQLAGHTKIMLHQEMTYAARAPRRILFFCSKPAEQGGETIIADMRRITRELPHSLRERMERLGALYVRNFAPPPDDGQEHSEDHPDQRSWQFAFYTDSKAEVEAACRDKGFEPVWLKNGGLMVRSFLPTFKDHPVTGEHIYCSSLHIRGGRDMITGTISRERQVRVEQMLDAQEAPTGCYLGDGSELTADEMNQLNALFDTAERSWAWEAGDIMLLDNLMTAHGRNPFEGTRDVQVALLD